MRMEVCIMIQKKIAKSFWLHNVVEESSFPKLCMQFLKNCTLTPNFLNNTTMAQKFGKSNQFCPFKMLIFFGMF